MENELRYYLSVIKKAITEVPAPVDEAELAEGCANVQPFKPSYIVTAVKLPTGAIELAVNNDHIVEKIDYILEAYDENMCLKTNPAVVMQNIMVV